MDSANGTQPRRHLTSVGPATHDNRASAQPAGFATAECELSVIGPRTLRVCGHLDATTAHVLAALLEHQRSSVHRRIRTVMSEVTAIDDAAVDIIADAARDLAARGGALIVVEPSRPVRKVLYRFVVGLPLRRRIHQARSDGSRPTHLHAARVSDRADDPTDATG